MASICHILLSCLFKHAHCSSLFHEKIIGRSARYSRYYSRSYQTLQGFGGFSGGQIAGADAEGHAALSPKGDAPPRFEAWEFSVHRQFLGWKTWEDSPRVGQARPMVWNDWSVFYSVLFDRTYIYSVYLCSCWNLWHNVWMSELVQHLWETWTLRNPWLRDRCRRRWLRRLEIDWLWLRSSGSWSLFKMTWHWELHRLVILLYLCEWNMAIL